MLTDVSVSISGPVLAFLLYENANNKGDQEGFLIGEVVNQVVGSISDSQIFGEKVCTVIKIYSVLPCPKCHTFYNGIGKVDPKELSRILGGKANDVVGWYRFCRNVSPKQFIRDIVLHKEIVRAVKETTSDLFLTCRLGISINNSRSTHNMDFSFYRFTNRGFEPVSIHIPNLGDTSHTEYKTAEEAASLDASSDDFMPLVNALSISDESYPLGATAIQKAYQRYLKNLVTSLGTSELKLAEAREMLRQLEEEIREREMCELESDEHEKAMDESGDDRLSSDSQTEKSTDLERNELMDSFPCDKGSPTESNDQSSSSQDLLDIDSSILPAVSKNKERQKNSNNICQITVNEKLPATTGRRTRKNK